MSNTATAAQNEAAQARVVLAPKGTRVKITMPTGHMLAVLSPFYGRTETNPAIRAAFGRL